MSTGTWLLFSGLGIIYLVLLVTLGIYTYRKGHMVWFIAGFLAPFCWLIGALLKAKPGSSYDRQQVERWK